MQMVVRMTAVLGALTILAQATPAAGHLRLTSHQARYGDSQKQGPCGLTGGERTTDKVYTAKPGTQVMLVWDEFINHPSHFRIAFDDDGHDFTDPHLACGGAQDDPDACFKKDGAEPGMVDGIADAQVGGVHNYLYTLPDVACDNCTLQVIQAMYDKAPFVTPGDDIYYQCLDLILDPDGPDSLTLIGGGGDPTDPTSPMGNPSDPVTNSACQSGGGGPLYAGLLLLALCFYSRRALRAAVAQ